jgi:hypothetical protein
MNPKILLLLPVVIAFGSCTTAYKTGQTPDDVYYSKARQIEEYVQTDKDNDYYRYDDDYYDDRYLRMKVKNRDRWNDLDDWYYNERRFRYNVFDHNCFGYDPWNPYTYWNSYYNPYYQPYYHTYSYVSIKSPTYTKPRTFNLNTYNSNQSGNVKTYGNYDYNPVRGNNNNNNNDYSPSSNSSGTGNTLRNIFGGNNTTSGGTKTTNSSGSGNNTSSGSGSGGGNAPVRRF